MRSMLGAGRLMAALVFSLLFLLAGCSTPGVDDDPDGGVQTDGGTDDDGGSGTDGGTDTDGGEEPPPPPAPELSGLESTGNFNPALPSTLLLGETTPVAIIGTIGTLYDPNAYGQPTEKYEQIAAGLQVLDRETGRIETYTVEDGLPGYEYSDDFGSYGVHAPPFNGMEWVTPDTSFIATTYEAVVRGDLGDDGRWTFEHTQLTAPDATDAARLGGLAMSPDGTAWIATTQGVFSVNPATLEATHYALADAPYVEDVAVGRMRDPENPDAFVFPVVVLHGPATSNTAADRVSVLAPGADTAVRLPLPQDRIPLSLAGGNFRVLVGVKRTTDGLGAIWGVEAMEAGSGYTISQAASPRQLYTPSQGYVLPETLTNDPVLVGGRTADAIRGGLISLSYKPLTGFQMMAKDVIDRQNPLFELLPWMYDIIETDADGNLWIKGVKACGGGGRREGGLLVLEEWHGVPRMVRPFVSGVRDITRDPMEGHLWLSLRDGQPGFACPTPSRGAMAVQQHLCRMRSDGGCEIFGIKSPTIDELIVPNPGVSDIAFGPEGSEQLALATYRDGLFAWMGENRRVVNTSIGYGLSLWQTSADWGPDGALWLGTQMPWETGVSEAVNDRSGHGLGLFEFDEAGAIAYSRRYVRNRSDNPQEEVAGLPSNQVWDVMALEGTRRAVVALGIERLINHEDHRLTNPAPSDHAPGVALIEDDTIQVIEAPAEAPFEDVVALFDSAFWGLLALDASGVYTVDLDTLTAERVLPAVWEDARPLSLAADADGRVAVGTSQGLWVFSSEGGGLQVLDDSRGFVWSLRFEAPGQLLAGTDQGLTHVALDGAELPAVTEEGGYFQWLWSQQDACTQADCGCRLDNHCDSGLGCACTDGANGPTCSCQPLDDCEMDPGSATCACDPADVQACKMGLECWGDAEAEICQEPEPEECVGAGCPCEIDEDCGAGFHCAYQINGFVCVEGDACLEDCSCSGEGATADGCQDGYACQPMGMGMQECVEVPCEYDCQCTGEGTTDGCPDGTTCVDYTADYGMFYCE